MKKNTVRRPFGMVEQPMKLTPPEPKLPPVDGKPVGAVDRYEARVLHEAVTYRVLSTRDVADSAHRAEGRTWEDVGRGEALSEVGRDRKLVYAITHDGRSCCVTERTVRVHDLIYG